MRDSWGNEIFILNPNTLKELRRSIGDKLMLIKDGFTGSYVDLIDIFKIMATRYNIRVFVVDNLMTITEFNDMFTKNKQKQSKP